MFIDTHAHLQEEAFRDDLNQILQHMQEAKVSQAIVVGTDNKDSQMALDLAKERKELFAAVGIHPHNAEKATQNDLDGFITNFQEEKVKACGEIGLDYYYEFSSRDVQKKWFADQLAIAYTHHMPTILHIRDAHQDTVDILRAQHGALPPCVIHCCSASKEMAKIYLDMGFYLSFTGIITFKNAKSPRETCAYAPLDRLMIETDCPYMTPVPFRGKRNEPAYVAYVAKEMARIKGEEEESLFACLNKNAQQFFQLSPPNNLSHF